jgi:hypothetical protein
LTLPSALGPTELNEAREPVEVTAATASTRLPSEGAPRVLWVASKPELPAEFTTTTPWEAAFSAALVLMAVLPSMSSNV